MQEVERDDPCPCHGGGISIASVLFDGEIHDRACYGMYSCQPQVTTGVYLVVLWRVGTGHPEVTGWPPRPRYINVIKKKKIKSGDRRRPRSDEIFTCGIRGTFELDYDIMG